MDDESCAFKFATPQTLNCGTPKPTCDEFCKELGKKRVGVPLACLGMDGNEYHCGRPGLANAELPPPPVLKCWSRRRLEGSPDLGGQYCQAEVPLGLKEPKAIAVALHYTCVITPEDTVECWGKTPSPVPADLGKVKSIEVFDDHKHICAIQMGGGLRCWGEAPLAGTQGECPGTGKLRLLLCGRARAVSCTAATPLRARTRTRAHAHVVPPPFSARHAHVQ